MIFSDQQTNMLSYNNLQNINLISFYNLIRANLRVQEEKIKALIIQIIEIVNNINDN